MASLIIKNAIEFFQKIKENKEVNLEFTKKDGSKRLMRCTLNFENIPKEKRPKDVNMVQILSLINKNKIIHVFDLDKQEWRSVPYDKVKWLEDDQNIKYSISI
jgi:uncharacterized pyridoxamine 5'-phosphate oxidase family protein